VLVTALAGTVLAAYVCSTAGAFVVRLNLTAIGFTMSHAAFAGAAFIVWVNGARGTPVGSAGSVDPVAGAIAFAVATAVALGPLSDRARLKADVTLGFMFSLLMALGFVFLSLTPGEAASGVALRIVWGSIFSVSSYDILYLVALASASTMFVLAFNKELMAVLFDRRLALASGVNARAFTYTILLLTGLAVALSLQLVGGLLVFALIINPASTAMQFLEDMRRVMMAAPVVGVATAVGGLLLSLQWDLPVGSAIIIVSAAVLAGAIVVSPRRRRAGAAASPPAPVGQI
jgi:ABC-type Mn2+/Zn2+ transport system permease subunit